MDKELTAVDLYNDYCSQSGVIGMKWGRRRYQNPDGSLTSLGRQHYGYGKGTSSLSKNGLKRRSKTAAVKKSARAEKKQQKADAKAAAKEAKKKANEIKYRNQKEYVKSLSDDQLKKINSRDQAEQTYLKNHPQQYTPMQKATRYVGGQIKKSISNNAKNYVNKYVDDNVTKAFNSLVKSLTTDTNGQSKGISKSGESIVKAIAKQQNNKSANDFIESFYKTPATNYSAPKSGSYSLKKKKK